MEKIWISAEVDCEELIESIPHELAKDFILALDQRLADYEFTVDLIETLQKSLNDEFEESSGKQKMYVELTQPKEVNVIKPHLCEWCDTKIDSGDKAMYRSFVNDDRIWSGYMHLECWKAMEQCNPKDLEIGWNPGDQGKGCLLGCFESEGVGEQ